MTRPRFLASLILAAVFLAACAPGTSTVPPVRPEVVEPSQPPSENPDVAATHVAEPSATSVAEQPAATAPIEAQPVATSRGPDLHATDPTTVSLASGGLQLVEFFRFT
jgi:hypothetical protein